MERAPSKTDSEITPTLHLTPFFFHSASCSSHSTFFLCFVSRFALISSVHTPSGACFINMCRTYVIAELSCLFGLLREQQQRICCYRGKFKWAITMLEGWVRQQWGGCWSIPWSKTKKQKTGVCMMNMLSKDQGEDIGWQEEAWAGKASIVSRASLSALV